LVLLSIFAGVFSARFGAPLLLVFLALGILAGEEGPGGILFRDFHAAYLIGSIALAIILFDGGLRTDPSDIRRALWPSLALATIGVIATAAIVGAAAVLLFSTSWTRGLLIGATVAPTDAAVGSGAKRVIRSLTPITYDSIRSADGAELTLYCGAANMGVSLKGASSLFAVGWVTHR